MLKLLSDRRQQLVDQRIGAVNRRHQLLAELLPGGAERRLTPTKARQRLSGVRPRDQVGKARKQLALDHVADVERLDRDLKALKASIGNFVTEHPSRVSEIGGVRPVMTALIRGEVGDVRRCPSKAHVASYTGTAPIDVSSGDHVRHRLNRGGNRRLNYALHIAALVQVRLPGPGRDYYLRKRDAGKTPLEAMRCLKRRLSDVEFRALVDDLEATGEAGPAGHSGATLQSSASDPTPTVSPSDKSLTGPANSNVTPGQLARAATDAEAVSATHQAADRTPSARCGWPNPARSTLFGPDGIWGQGLPDHSEKRRDSPSTPAGSFRRYVA